MTRILSHIYPEIHVPREVNCTGILTHCGMYGRSRDQRLSYANEGSQDYLRCDTHPPPQDDTLASTQRRGGKVGKKLYVFLLAYTSTSFTALRKATSLRRLWNTLVSTNLKRKVLSLRSKGRDEHKHLDRSQLAKAFPFVAVCSIPIPSRRPSFLPSTLRGRDFIHSCVWERGREKTRFGNARSKK